ncbi:MAG: DUF92 domain-containing protein [Candidatus Altiarchaeota archaeon]|nr:DUF92 domain-containing protein [Candidatus Altiarchaeota archaeon]
MYEIIPLGFILVEQLTSKFFDEKAKLVFKKALFSATILTAILIGLPFEFLLGYMMLVIGLSINDESIYTSLFGSVIGFVAIITANPIVGAIPLAVMSIAVPTAYFLTSILRLAQKGIFWKSYMYLFSTAIISQILVSLGPINPLWGLALGAIVTWAAKLDDSFSLPLLAFMSVGYIYSSPSALVAGFGFSLIASSFAYYLRSLNFEGLVTAILSGTMIYAASPVLFLALLGFLVSSSLLGKFAIHDERFQKKGERNSTQVLSNSFAVALAGFLILMGADALIFGIAAISAATADTWATEIGSLSKKRPRMITTLKLVERGKSGGVTALGLLGSLIAGLFIFLITAPFYGLTYFFPAVVGGAFGSLFDSLLGATFQAIHRCRICKKATENSEHCGKSTNLENGLWWLNNDMVNLFASLTAMLVVL